MDSKESHVPNIKISVIVPVFNTQKYLKECMDSVLAQNFKEMEVICIDDGSTDNCPGMLDNYAVYDKRVKVFHISNGGYGHAVNYGIDHAKGKYIGIVEPDDYIQGEMFEKFYNISEKYDLDMVSSNYICFTGDRLERIFRVNEVVGEERFYDTVLNPYEEKKLFEGTYLNQAGLYNREFLEQYHIRHHESSGASFQDVGFRLQILTYCKRLMILHDAFYCYRKDNPNSSVNNRTNINRIINEYGFVFNILQRDRIKFENLLPELTKCKITDYLGEYDRLVPELRQEFSKIVRDELIEYKRKGEFITTNLTYRQQQRLEYLMSDPDHYENRDKRLKEEIHSQICYDNSFIIYGVGMFGKKIYDVMSDEDKEKLLGYAVADITCNIKDYCGVPVKEISMYDNNITVMIGVTEKYESEVIGLLKNKGTQRIICLEAGVWF